MSSDLSPGSCPGTTQIRSPLVAAWDTGRLLNQLRFHAVQAWLLANADQANRTLAAFDAITAALREAIPDVDAQANLIGVCNQERENWVAAFASVEHHDSRVSANSEAEHLLSTIHSTETIAERVLDSLQRPAQAVYLILRRAITAHIADAKLHAFDFGELVDQALHPPTIYRSLLLATDEPNASGANPGTERSAETSGQPIGWTGTGQAETYRYQWYLPTRPMESTTAIPTSQWFQSVVHYWRILQLPGAPPSVNDLERSGLSAFIEKTDRRVRTAALQRELTPFWDAEKGELRLGTTVVRTIPPRAKNIITVLAVFQEEGWPRRVDSPFPPKDPKLHETIKLLNKNLLRIQFHADGTGNGLVWDWRASSKEASKGSPQERHQKETFDKSP